MRFPTTWKVRLAVVEVVVEQGRGACSTRSADEMYRAELPQTTLLQVHTRCRVCHHCFLTRLQRDPPSRQLGARARAQSPPKKTDPRIASEHSDIDMQGLSYAIRSKPDWHIKRKDPVILAKWRTEALEQAAQQGDGGLTEAMIDYTLAELELHERDLGDAAGIRVRIACSCAREDPKLTHLGACRSPASTR